MDDVKLFSLILEKSRPADTWSWCVYIYIYLPRCTLVTGWIDLSRRSNIGFSFGGRANSRPPSRHLFARALVNRRDFDMRIVDSRNWRTEGRNRRAFPPSLFSFLSLSLYPSRFVMTRRDGSGSVGHSRQFDWAIAVYLSPVRLGQYQFRGIVAWQVFKQLIQDRFLWYIKRSNFSIVGTMNSKSCRPIDQNYYNISFYLHLFVLFSFRLKRSLWLIIYSSFCFLLTPNCLSVK